VSKTGDAASVDAGDSIGYTITVSNAGPGAAKNVTLSDPLPANPGLSWSINGGPNAAECSIGGGSLSCNFGTVIATGSKTVHITSPTTSGSCGTVSNTATTAASNEANTANNSSGAVDITVLCPDLSVSKTADAASVDAGDSIGYTITVSNAGPGAAKNVTLSDPLPANPGLSWSINGGPNAAECSIGGGSLSCNFGTVIATGSKTVHISSPTTSGSCGTVSNTATTAASNEANTANNSSGAVDITVLCPDLSVSKTADAASVDAGDSIGYTITVSNAGPGAAKNVTLSDPLPVSPGLSWSINGGPNAAECSIGGGSLSCNFGTVIATGSKTVHISSPTTSSSCGTVSNTATTAASNEANTANNSSGAVNITVLCPDLVVSKTPDASTVNSTDTVGFTITVTNNGAGQAKNVMLSDTLPTNSGLSWSINGGADAGQCTITTGTLSCNFGTVIATGSKTVHITSPTTPNTCGSISNTATASASNEASTGNNSGSASISVNCPDLLTTKLADASPVNAGNQIGFTITVKNNGLGLAKSVMLSDSLPNNTGMTWTIDPLNSDTGCTISGTSSLSCSFGNLVNGATKKVHVTSPTTPANCGAVTNTATATATNERASDTANNSSTASIVLADTTAPTINTNGQLISLWSPNHKYETFKTTDFVTGVNDSCQGNIAVTGVYIWKVTSDEPENINSGDGNTFKDMVIANDCRSVDLRAERDGNKNGRVYTIYMRVKDSAGNVGETTIKVTVPHSQGPKGVAVDDGPVYTVYNNNCP
jgi:uncharacterized repeat protein (TIGR01451 family)